MWNNQQLLRIPIHHTKQKCILEPLPLGPPTPKRRNQNNNPKPKPIKITLAHVTAWPPYRLLHGLFFYAQKNTTTPYPPTPSIFLAATGSGAFFSRLFLEIIFVSPVTLIRIFIFIFFLMGGDYVLATVGVILCRRTFLRTIFWTHPPPLLLFPYSHNIIQAKFGRSSVPFSAGELFNNNFF